ncbi:MAG: Gfo/Idh/MocA family oxidoreductase, partial [Bacteroidales bacterium]|nr:Gfo/Idh/MocA family oxidoreductase [Bacteroidales bacterium]
MGSNSKINRRKFIERGALGLMGLPLLSSGLRSVAPSDRVRVAVIGLGSQGRSHMTWFNNLPEVEIAALCDLDTIRLERARSQLQKINPDSRAEIFSDFRHILDRKDIDVVTCATPDHWHA